MLQKNPSLQCAVCGTQFGGTIQFHIYCCESCGKQHIICPTCAAAIPPCPSCKGHLLPNDIYIEKYGITDIYGNHFPINAPLLHAIPNLFSVVGKITTFYNELAPTHRYASYDFCYIYFQAHKGHLATDMEKSCYCLWSYLGSWGMLRGSSQLLQHSPASLKPLIQYFDSIADSPIWTIDVPQYMQDNNRQIILDVYNEIQKIMKTQVFQNQGGVSVTLVTKIMLGVFGVVPALDTYFKQTFNNLIPLSDGKPIKFSSTLGNEQLYAIYIFYRIFKVTLDAIKIYNTNFDETKSNIPYKIAKLIDMFGFMYSLPSNAEKDTVNPD